MAASEKTVKLKASNHTIAYVTTEKLTFLLLEK